MKDETQATHLQKMMQNHPSFHTYELILSPVRIKKSMLSRVEKGDVILLGTQYPKLYLLRDNCICASVKLERCKKSIVISDILHESKAEGNTTPNKKDETLFCLLGSLRTKEIKEGTIMDIGSLDTKQVTLMVAGISIAQGCLVRVGTEIGVEIENIER